jgi:hypothetical protein
MDEDMFVSLLLCVSFCIILGVYRVDLYSFVGVYRVFFWNTHGVVKSL